MTELAKKAFEADSKYPQIFIADEIHKKLSLPPTNVELLELRKKVKRFQKLLEQLRNREKSIEETKGSDERLFQEYQIRHKHKNFTMEAIKNAYCVQSTNPLKFVAEMIRSQPDYKILVRKETEDQEKRIQIYTNVIKVLIEEKPLNLKEIEEFSTKTVLQEMKETNP